MRSSVAHWNFLALVVVSAVLLGSGWLINSASLAARAELVGLHTSLGVAAAATIFVQICLRLAFPPTPYPERRPRWRRALGRATEFLVYLSFVAMVASGVLGTIFSGSPLTFFGTALPGWTADDRSLSELLGPFWNAPLRAAGAADMMTSAFFRLAHGAAAIVLAAAIVAHIGVALLNGVDRSDAPPRALPEGLQEPAAHAETAPAPASHPAPRLARRLRVLGWIQFWFQLALALVSGLLLQFATSGRAFSPGASGFGDAIYWSFNGFLLLCLADALAFYYTRAANRLASRPASLDETRKTAFWFLHAGLLTGLAGELISFVGVSLSISLLIAKTVSQPPGIAITDPNKIIRALDVFILLTNFGLLAAHFVGTAFAAWLVAGASHARLRYAATARRLQDDSA